MHLAVYFFHITFCERLTMEYHKVATESAILLIADLEIDLCPNNSPIILIAVLICLCGL